MKIAGGESSPGRGSSQCKGPEAGVCLICSENSQEACVAGAEQARDRAVRNEVGQVTWGGAHVPGLCFPL